MTIALLTRFAHVTVCVTLLALLNGCASPIGVVRGSVQETYFNLTANVLSAGQPSSWSMQALQRANLTERFNDDQEAAIGELRKTIQQQESSDRFADRLFALSELSFYFANQSGKNDYFLAAAVYAYAYLFPENGTPPPDPLDPRRRLAADIYNLGLVRGLDSPDGEEVVLQAGTLSLPFGELELTLDERGFVWGGFRFKRLIPVGEFEVRGFSNRYRQAGIGAPLAAELEPLVTGPAAEVAQKRIPPNLKVPVTAFIHIADPRRAVTGDKLKGRIELYPSDQTSTVTIDGREVPLELEPTAAMAYMLEGAPVWEFELAGFRFADESKVFGDGLIMLNPYQRGRIPVVLVHGTASSPARWAEMINELANDPVLGRRYQFWLFQYNTGQPILYSAMLLRRALRNVIADFDPNDEDPALRRMVIIGHSQGGLLTKLMAISSGNRFWDNMSSVPFDQVEMKPETRELLREATFFEPLPFVTRVVFIATPHRGSFQATGWVLNLIRRLIHLPGTLVPQFQDLVKSQEFAQLGMSQLPTSVENMSPGHPFIRALAESPIDPHIAAHSIIAVLGEGALTGKTDGVVAYESAHIDGVESEKIVRSSHSTQGNPETIEEVRRILREHLAVK